MIYTIENDVLRVDIENIGAELMSIYSKKTGTEYLWQGDKKYWGSRAPLLFPICGRLYKNEYTYKDKKYEMMLHGFARKMAFTVESHSKE